MQVYALQLPLSQSPCSRVLHLHVGAFLCESIGAIVVTVKLVRATPRRRLSDSFICVKMRRDPVGPA